MDSIKDTIQELTQHFNARMAEFQQNLTSSIPATSPTSNILAQFSSFRTFVLSALEGLQLQILLLAKQQDNFEMRSGRKMLLIHGISEDKKENVSESTIIFLVNSLKIPDLFIDDIDRCHRLGSTVLEKPRPIIIKFKDLSFRNKVWYSKTKLKNTRVTLSAFLTKSRHDTFMAARRRFGTPKCWTKNGFVIVVGPDGKRHSITSTAELNNIPTMPESQLPASSAPLAQTSELKAKPALTVRAKRTLKK